MNHFETRYIQSRSCLGFAPLQSTSVIMSQFHQLTKTQPESVTKLNLPGNTSVVLLKKETIEVRDEPLPILQPDGVLVKVIATDMSCPVHYSPQERLKMS